MIDFTPTPVREMVLAHRGDDAPPPGPSLLNLDAVLELLGEDPVTPFNWGGVDYRVRETSFLEGVRLKKAQLRWAAFLVNPPLTLPELEEQERLYDETIALMGSLLEDPPAENPFRDARPVEVGQLLGFFSLCLMRSPASSRFQMSGHAPPTS